MTNSLFYVFPRLFSDNTYLCQIQCHLSKKDFNTVVAKHRSSFVLSFVWPKTNEKRKSKIRVAIFISSFVFTYYFIILIPFDIFAFTQNVS